MAALTIADRDFGFAKVLAGLGDLRGRGVRVGFMGGAQHDAEGGKPAMDMARLAATQEEGVEDEGGPDIPARPVIRPMADQQGPGLANACAHRIAKGIDAQGPEIVDKALGQLGATAEAALKAAYINAFERVQPLAQSTLDARKRRSVGSDHPLVDTGQLVGSVRFEVP